MARAVLEITGIRFVRREPAAAMSISTSGMTSSPVPATSTLLGGTSAKKNPSAEHQFLKIAAETPLQRKFNAKLSQLGICEDDFKAMSPAEQQKVTEKIQQMIEQQAQNGGAKTPGLVKDKSVCPAGRPVAVPKFYRSGCCQIIWIG